MSRTVLVAMAFVVAACGFEASDTPPTETTSTPAAPTTTHQNDVALMWRHPDVGMTGSYLPSNGELVLMDSERVFVGDGFGDGDDDYSVSAFDVETGALSWQREDLTDGVDDVFLQALVGDQLIVNGQYNSVTAVDAVTGDTMWSYAFPEGYGAVRTSAVEGQLVVVTTAPSEGDQRPPIVFSMDLDDGELRWKSELAEGTQAQWHSPPLGNGLVFVASTSSYTDSASGNMLHALDLGTGTIAWSKDLGGGEGYHFYPNLVASGNLVIQAPSGDIEGLDPRDGSDLWTYTGANPLGISAEGHVYAFDGAVVDLDPMSGEAARLVDHEGLDGFRPDAAVADQGLLVLSGSDGLVSYDLETLALAWQWRPYDLTATPSIYGETAAIVTGEPALTLIRFSLP